VEIDFEGAVPDLRVDLGDLRLERLAAGLDRGDLPRLDPPR
jgi:hypothetical protein